MTSEDRKYAIERINFQLEDRYVDFGCHDEDEIEVIKEAIDKATSMKIKEVKAEYDILKPICPRCGDDLLGNYCSECGQKLSWE